MRPQIHLLTAMQGGLTLELAREHHPDLIVLDLHLPDIQGDEVLAQLRADPRTAGIPVVMCSADATERRRKQLLAAGAHAYLTKPVKVQRFLRMLDEVLNSIPVSPPEQLRCRRSSRSSAAPLPAQPLGAEVAYGGPLRFPASPRPYVIANFVASIDGVASLGLTDGTDSTTLSGSSRADRYLMGLLRASADAVVIGAGNLRATPGHQWTPAAVAGDDAPAIEAFRFERTGADAAAAAGGGVGERRSPRARRARPPCDECRCGHLGCGSRARFAPRIRG